MGAVVFGVCANKFEDVVLDYDEDHGRRFGWAFWLDCAAAGAALLTALIYMLDGRGRKV